MNKRARKTIFRLVEHKMARMGLTFQTYTVEALIGKLRQATFSLYLCKSCSFFQPFVLLSFFFPLFVIDIFHVFTLLNDDDSNNNIDNSTHSPKFEKNIHGYKKAFT